MSWARVDDGFDDHPKVVALLDEDDQTNAAVAIGLWTLCLTWAHRNTRKRGQTPGLLPAGLPRRFIGPVGKDAARLLVAHGLWEPQDDGGWIIHDFGDYLPTDETRNARAEAGRKGAEKRWAAKRQDGMANSHDSDGTLPSVSHDVATSPIANDGSRAPARRDPTPVPVPIATPNGVAKTTLASLAPGASFTQRSKAITDAYSVVQPMSKWPAVNAIVLKAIKTGRWSDEEIHDALQRLAADGRSVTIDTLRIELTGPPKNRAAPQQRGYVEMNGMVLKETNAHNLALIEELQAEDAQTRQHAIEGAA